MEFLVKYKLSNYQTKQYTKLTIISRNLHCSYSDFFYCHIKLCFLIFTENASDESEAE